MSNDLEYLDETMYGELQIVTMFDSLDEQREPEIVASPIAWVTGKVADDGHGFVVWPERCLASLPVEFWNHQLRQVNLRDRSALAEFLSTWGVPYHPFRNLPYLSEKIRDRVGITATEEHARIYVPRPHPNEVSAGYFFTSPGSPRLSYISSEELISALSILRLCVNILVYSNELADPALIAEATRVINSASSNSNRISLKDLAGAVIWNKQGETLETRGLLTSAICNQLIATYADDAAWKTCACEGCETVFKRKQPDSITVRPDSDSKYCCNRCKNRQAKRNQRAAAKSRIKH